MLPADNPFTLDVDEGIPVDGNFIDPTIASDQQVNFEGRLDTKGNIDPTDDTNVNFDVIVGQTSFGVLLISGESALRDENLIIGDSGPVGTGNPAFVAARAWSASRVLARSTTTTRTSFRRYPPELL